VLCHGPISLLSALPNSTEVVQALAAGDAIGAREKAQGWIYSGYKITIFSTALRYIVNCWELNLRYSLSSCLTVGYGQRLRLRRLAARLSPRYQPILLSQHRFQASSGDN